MTVSKTEGYTGTANRNRINWRLLQPCSFLMISLSILMIVNAGNSLDTAN